MQNRVQNETFSVPNAQWNSPNPTDSEAIGAPQSKVTIPKNQPANIVAMLTLRLRQLSRTTVRSLNKHVLQSLRTTSHKKAGVVPLLPSNPFNHAPFSATATATKQSKDSQPNADTTKNAVVPADKSSVKYRYVGELADGVGHGEGSAIFEDGSVYEGEFHKGRFHGTGKFIFPNGISCEGQWVRGLREGNFRFR